MDSVSTPVTCTLKSALSPPPASACALLSLPVPTPLPLPLLSSNPSSKTFSPDIFNNKINTPVTKTDKEFIHAKALHPKPNLTFEPVTKQLTVYTAKDIGINITTSNANFFDKFLSPFNGIKKDIINIPYATKVVLACVDNIIYYNKYFIIN